MVCSASSLRWDFQQLEFFLQLTYILSARLVPPLQDGLILISALAGVERASLAFHVSSKEVIPRIHREAKLHVKSTNTRDSIYAESHPEN